MSDSKEKNSSYVENDNYQRARRPRSRVNDAEKSFSAPKNEKSSSSQNKDKRKSSPNGASSKRSRSNSRDNCSFKEINKHLYPGAIDFEKEDHFIFLDQAWPQRLIDSASGINFICRPNTCLSDIANEIISVIENRNPNKRTYITASIFTNFVKVYKPEGIMKVVDRISAFIKDPRADWDKQRHDPDKEYLPSIFKVFLTYPTLPYKPSLEHIWPELADLNQWLKSETLSLHATPFNFNKWISKQARDNNKLREIRGTMYVEYNTKVGLGETLTYEAKESVTNHLIVHHITGVRYIVDISINNEAPPVPLARTGGYQMVESNRNNAWIYKHMGAMDAKIQEYNLCTEQEEKQRREEEKLKAKQEKEREEEIAREKEREEEIAREKEREEKIAREKAKKEREQNPEYLMKVIQQKDKDFIEMKEAKGRASNSLGQMTDNFLNLRTKNEALEKDHNDLKYRYNKLTSQQKNLVNDIEIAMEARNEAQDKCIEFKKEITKLEGLLKTLKEKEVRQELKSALQKQKETAEKKEKK